jgi:hypothetical protein
MPELKNESKIPASKILVDKYRVTREIGRGGMAAVYEAEQLGARQEGRHEGARGRAVRPRRS